MSSELNWPQSYGWKLEQVPAFSAGFLARVTADFGHQQQIITASGDHQVPILPAHPRPAVGDWLQVTEAGGGGLRIAELLERRNVVSRKAAGQRTEEQVFAANVDVVLVLTSLDRDFSVRRIERFLATAYQCGARPVVALTKVDCCPDVAPYLAALEAISLTGTPVVPISPLTGAGVTELTACWGETDTVVAVGSSGVGKSTLLNGLRHETLAATGRVRRADGKGRHTTTRRQLWRLAHGCYIDTPGIREMGLWVEEQAVDTTFGDVLELARTCRFSDCGHGSEPGCAVRGAIAEGRLDGDRLVAYQRLREDARRTMIRKDKVLARQADRELGKLYRSVQNAKRRLR